MGAQPVIETCRLSNEPVRLSFRGANTLEGGAVLVGTRAALQGGMPKTLIQRSQPRRSQRLRIDTPQATFFTVDVSAGGVSFESLNAPARGRCVAGTIHVGKNDYGFEGVVAWVRAGDVRVNQRGRCGIRFTSTEAGFSEALVASRSASNPAVTPPLRAAPVTAMPVALVQASQGPTVVLQGEVWVVTARAQSGRQQEFRCAGEAQARKLATALTSADVATGL